MLKSLIKTASNAHYQGGEVYKFRPNWSIRACGLTTYFAGLLMNTDIILLRSKPSFWSGSLLVHAHWGIGAMHIAFWQNEETPG